MPKSPVDAVHRRASGPARACVQVPAGWRSLVRGPGSWAVPVIPLVPLLVALLMLVALAGRPARAAEAEPRVALVIGNAAYADAALRNPVNDARAMATTLRALGFTVLAHENLGRRALEQAILGFGRRIAEGGVGLVYYAGHGMQVRGRNYLVPVDARISDEASVRVASVDIDLVLEQISSARNRVNVIVLDACRNNPFERKLRGTAQGLAAIDAARGTLVAYATSPGSVAADGEGEHGLYTEELLRALQVPGLKIEEVFKRVRAAVAQRSKGAQTPWESSSLTGDLVINVQVQAPAAPTADRDALFWSSIKDSRDAAPYQAYLNQFPQGTFAELARQRIAAAGGGSVGGPARTPGGGPVAEAGTAAPSPASSVGSMTRFDGRWAVRMVCEGSGPRVQGYTRELVMEVIQGLVRAEQGTEGKVGYLLMQGRIRPDGQANLRVRGITGEARFSLDNVPAGTPYGFAAVAQFDDRQGSGRRTEQRICALQFTRQ